MSAALTNPEWTTSADLLLREVAQPTLVIFGERDTVVDCRESVDVCRDAYMRSGNADLTIKTFANADHDLVRTDVENSYENLRLADGYIDAMVAWLAARQFAVPKK